jgi:hypothetical protein
MTVQTRTQANKKANKKPTQCKAPVSILLKEAVEVLPDMASLVSDAAGELSKLKGYRFAKYYYLIVSREE